MSADPWPYPGSRWWRFDVHAHTPASLDTRGWQAAVGTDREVTPEQWLGRFMAAEVDCVAVTDHNTGAWIDRLKRAYARMKEDKPEGFRPLHLFPGVELSVNGGVHLLALFDLGADTSDIDRLLGAVAYHGNRGDSDGVTRKSLEEVLEEVRRAGGLPIPAHVDLVKGLFHAGPGEHAPGWDANTLRQVIESGALMAVEQVDLAARLHPATEHVGWPRVLGSDTHSFRGERAPGSRFTWVKMARPCLEGLRLALLDGEGVSVRRSDQGPFEPFRLPAHHIRSIEVEQARYLGRTPPARIELSPYLNALIGGRGTGKSSMVHAVRLAYGRKGELVEFPEESGPRAVFREFVRAAKSRADTGALTSETEVRVTLMREGVRHRLRWRRDSGETTVEQRGDRGWRPAERQFVSPDRFPLRILSQGQIMAMAERGGRALMQVVDQAASVGELERELREATGSYLWSSRTTPTSWSTATRR